eukprot:scaffold496073_cov98-Attheya_sp.AAC.1
MDIVLTASASSNTIGSIIGEIYEKENDGNYKRVARNSTNVSSSTPETILLFPTEDDVEYLIVVVDESDADGGVEYTIEVECLLEELRCGDKVVNSTSDLGEISELYDDLPSCGTGS